MAAVSPQDQGSNTDRGAGLSDRRGGLARQGDLHLRERDKVSEAIGWFRELNTAGEATDWDTIEHAEFLEKHKQLADAAALFESVASNPRQFGLRSNVELWVSAAFARWSNGESDDALRDARSGIAAGAKENNSEMSVATLHTIVANILNDRGVYEQAIDAARQAIPWMESAGGHIYSSPPG